MQFGRVFKVTYFQTLKKHRRTFVFWGVCNQYRKRSKTFKLRNFHHSTNENLEISLVLFSPYLINLERLDGYSLPKSKSSLKKIRIKTPINRMLYNEKKKQHDPYDFIYSFGLNISEKHRLRWKFRL
jgi:hypothetical protein